jgi:hypothetical protein
LLLWLSLSLSLSLFLGLGILSKTHFVRAKPGLAPAGELLLLLRQKK